MTDVRGTRGVDLVRSLIAAGAALLLAGARPVAAQISSASSSTAGASCSGGGTADGDCRNSPSLPVNNGVTLQSRYAWNINADTGSFSTHDPDGNAQHNVSFNATAPGGYRLDITTQ